jgi:hypothetical protein
MPMKKSLTFEYIRLVDFATQTWQMWAPHKLGIIQAEPILNIEEYHVYVRTH